MDRCLLLSVDGFMALVRDRSVPLPHPDRSGFENEAQGMIHFSAMDLVLPEGEIA